MSSDPTMSNTLDNIKTLQEKEARLYSSLGVSINGDPLDSAGQEKILSEINSLTELRVNLISELKNQYNSLSVNVDETNNDIMDELDSIAIMEQQLDEKKAQLNKMKTIETNKLRMADINNYYAERSEFVSSIYYTIVLMLASICAVLITRKLLPIIPQFVFGSLILLISITGIGYVIYKLRDLYSRDKMNFSQYDFSGINAQAMGQSVYDYDMNQLGKLRDVLVDQEKQIEGKVSSYFGTDGDYLLHQCNNDDGKVYISAKGKQYSKSNKTMSQCQADCSADDTCEMFLMSDDNTCRLYKDISDTAAHCESGSGSEWWGKIKKAKPSKEKTTETFVNFGSVHGAYDPLWINNYEMNLLH